MTCIVDFIGNNTDDLRSGKRKLSLKQYYGTYIKSISVAKNDLDNISSISINAGEVPFLTIDKEWLDALASETFSDFVDITSPFIKKFPMPSWHTCDIEVDFTSNYINSSKKVHKKLNYWGFIQYYTDNVTYPNKIPLFRIELDSEFQNGKIFRIDFKQPVLSKNFIDYPTSRFVKIDSKRGVFSNTLSYISGLLGVQYVP